MDLASLIGSRGWNQLQHHFQHKQTTLGRADDRDRFHELWSEWELEAVLTCVALTAADSIRIVTQGKSIKPIAYRDRNGLLVADAVAQLRKAGASINIMRAEDYSNRILALSRSLEEAFSCPVQCNLYVTPGQAQGLGAHHDSHDVLILQLRGEKHWEIEGFGGATTGGVAASILKTGDWLFVPRGVRHEVRNRAPEPSVHLAIGFHPLTWGDVLQVALDTARKSVPALNEAVEVSADSAVLRSTIEPKLLALVPHVDVAEQHRRYHGSFPCLGLPVPRSDTPACKNPDVGDENTRFAWRTESASFEGLLGAGAIDLPFRRSPLVLRPELRDAIRRMHERREFCPAELGLATAQAVRLCRLLANVAVLRMT